METLIRLDRPTDFTAVAALHRSAFGGDTEARLVAELREGGKGVVSLVAEQQGEVVGHLLFSPVRVAGDERHGVGLAPLAVRPERQRQGIGSQLVEEGLAACRDAGYGWVVVLGEPEFYGRFGFRAAAEFGLVDEFGAPPGVFQAQELQPQSLDGLHGTVRYAEEFSAFAEPGDAGGAPGRGNLLEGIPAELPDEWFEALAGGRGARVERIVSRGHVSPPDFWYDQEEDEWVMVLQGAARLTLLREGREERVELGPNDWLHLPAHTRHRVEWTRPEGNTVWLALFFPGDGVGAGDR